MYQNYKLEDLHVKDKVQQKFSDDEHWECIICGHPNSIKNMDSCLLCEKSSGVPENKKEIVKEI